MSARKEKSLGSKVVMAKIPREEFSRLQEYSKHNNVTINAALRRIIQSEIDNPRPGNIAGKSAFTYNRNRDSFSWKIILDDGEVFNIEDDLPVNTLDQLLGSILHAIEERNSFIKKNKVDSVSFPNRLMRRRK